MALARAHPVRPAAGRHSYRSRRIQFLLPDRHVHRDFGSGFRAVVVPAALSAVRVGALLDRVGLRSLMRAQTSERVRISAEVEEPRGVGGVGTSSSIEFSGVGHEGTIAMHLPWAEVPSNPDCSDWPPMGATNADRIKSQQSGHRDSGFSFGRSIAWDEGLMP